MTRLHVRGASKQRGAWHFFHTGWRRSITVLRWCTVVPLLSGCFGSLFGGDDQCTSYAERCVGNVRQTCDPPCSDIGCSSQWRSEDTCSGTCIEIDANDTLCTLSTTTDPRCDGVDGYCDGDTRVACSNGYAYQKETCSDLPSGSAAVFDAGAPPQTPSTCVDTGGDSKCTMPLTWCTGAPATCGALPNCGPVVTTTSLSDAVPAALGGDIVDGTYFLTDLNVYGGSMQAVPFQVQVTQSVHSGVLSTSYYSGSTSDYSSGPYSVHDDTIESTPTCPSGLAANAIRYTATASTLILYDALGPVTYEFVHRLQ
jgi:hypothetical protein